MTLWNEVKDNLRDWYDTAADRTGELTQVGLRRYDIFGISREIERQFGEIGSHVYDAMASGQGDFTGDAQLEDLVAKVRSLEEELKVKERQIEDIRSAHRQERESRRSRREPGPEASGADEVGESEPVYEAEPAAEPSAGDEEAP